MPSSCIFFFLLLLIAAATAREFGHPPTDKISIVGQTCFEYNHPISVYFSNQDAPTRKDWIALVPAVFDHHTAVDSEAMLSMEHHSPPAWAWVCEPENEEAASSQGCISLYGKLIFGGLETPTHGSWPLAPGSYRAMLLHGDDGSNDDIASPAFEVLPYGKSCPPVKGDVEEKQKNV